MGRVTSVNSIYSNQGKSQTGPRFDWPALREAVGLDFRESLA